MVNLKLRVYELPLRFVHVKFETSGIWAPLRTFFIASLKIQVCGYTPILGLVIYDCLPDYAVPEFWRRPLMGPGAKVKRVTKKCKRGKQRKTSPQRFPLASSWRRPDHQAVTAGWDYLSWLIFSQWSHIGRISYISYMLSYLLCQLHNRIFTRFYSIEIQGMLLQPLQLLQRSP